MKKGDLVVRVNSPKARKLKNHQIGVVHRVMTWKPGFRLYWIITPDNQITQVREESLKKLYWPGLRF